MTFAFKGYPCLKPTSVACSVDRSESLLCVNYVWTHRDSCAAAHACGEIFAGSHNCSGSVNCIGCTDL